MNSSFVIPVFYHASPNSNSHGPDFMPRIKKKGRKPASKVIWCDRGWMPVYYGFCPDEKAWHREMKKLGAPKEPYPTSDGRCSTFTAKEKTACVVTIANELDAKDDPVGLVGLIVHEATHVWQTLRETIGETDPSREFEAYSIQNISIGLFKAYAQTRTSVGKKKR